MTNERLMIIAFNAICGLEELVGFSLRDIKSYLGISTEEYNEIMYYWEDRLNDSERLKLYDQAMAWVYEHCSDMTTYAYALNAIGFSKEQATEELNSCSYGEECPEQSRAEAIREVYGDGSNSIHV